MTVVSQVWQTPVRQDQRTGTGTPEVPEPPGAMGVGSGPFATTGVPHR
jgi:hypothetical protein